MADGNKLKPKADEENYPVCVTLGADNTLQVRGRSTYEERQEIASCVLDVVADLTSEQFVDERANRQLGYALGILSGLAKSLLDSMVLRNPGEST